MAWNPKTTFGKILKGAVGVGGSILGTVTGLNVLGGAARAVGNVVEKGTTVLTKASGVLNNMRTTADKVADSAKDLASGYTKEINEVNRATKDQLRKQVGDAIGEHVITGPDGIETTVKKQALADFFKSDVVKYGAIALIALFVLPKIFKSRR